MSLKLELTCDEENCEHFLELEFSSLSDSFNDIVEFSRDNGWLINFGHSTYSSSIVACCPHHNPSVNKPSSQEE